MTLIDTGPLVALLDHDDQHHMVCRLALRSLPLGILVTTWPCFTEAMHLLNRVGGHPYKAALWQLRASGRLSIHDLSPAQADRMAVLMEKYRDAPMDLADASLVPWLKVGPYGVCSRWTVTSGSTDCWTEARLR